MGARPKQFEREDRYIVIKRSDLAKVPVNYRKALVDPLVHLQAHLPRRECLVIESDWPEYPVAWQMIEARMTGASLPVGVPDESMVEAAAAAYDRAANAGATHEQAWHEALSVALTAAPAAQPAADHSQRALIRHAMNLLNLLNLRNHVPGSDVDICVQDLRKLLDGQPVTTPPPSEAWREVAEIAQAEAPAVVNQQVTTAACLWKREQDSGFYETGCGQTWHFTDGTTPEENSAYFCHHCGKSLEVQRLIAYQVGDNDIVAAYDPAGAIEVLCTYNGYEPDEFTVDEVVAVSDSLLDSTEAFDQDEGKTVPLEKTLRQELEELTEPAYLHGWE
ncbi:MAG TPA: hypothetical protein DEO91_14945 [Pseudomonas sp.]|nr:hypothetical protein [Pseudomonas sp.]